MKNKNKIQKLGLVKPTKANNYCVFCNQFEYDKNIAFHMTKRENLCSIIHEGFLSKQSLSEEGLPSIYFAKKSSTCFDNFGNNIMYDMVIIAVKFDNLDQDGIETNDMDIRVNESIQPKILAYCEVQAGYRR